ncbi:glycosyltransferase [Mycobacteriaceae bacterium 1482268.1]|nr:glycosyltransferase [Mycobacteriaceae bacterium 1482268.1]
MRILHVVTLISPDAAYGGPVRVALNQAAALQDRGHDVVVAAAARGFDPLPDSIGGVRVELFEARTRIPRIGFAGLGAAGMTRWIGDHASEFDLVHVHLARDFVTLPAARVCLKRGIPVVVQPHGMIDFSSNLLAKPLDAFWTRPVLRSASTVFHLTPRESRDLRGVAGESLTMCELNNGVPEAIPRNASASGQQPEVLFLARLHPRKRPDMFVRMAQQLIAEGYGARFSLVGPDEGARSEAEALIAEFGLESYVRCEGHLDSDHTASRLRKAAVYVLPAVDEPYPMSVLEAMAVGLPVVVTDTCGLAPLVEETQSGIVVGPELESLTNAVRGLLDDPRKAIAMGENARRAVSERSGMASVTDVLERTYRRVLGLAAEGSPATT